MILKVRLLKILKERGMTQKKLAEDSGLKESVIAEMVSNKRNSINRYNIGVVAKTLGNTDGSDILHFEE